MPTFESTLATILTILTITALIFSFRAKIYSWYDNTFLTHEKNVERIINIELKIDDLFARQIKAEIKREIEAMGPISDILELQDEYTSIPTKDGKKRNGPIEHMVTEYIKKRSCE